MKIFEIHDLTTNEVLADNLEFDELPVLFNAYANFYPTHEFMAFYREAQPIKRAENPYKVAPANYHEFQTQWFDMVEEFSCNFY